MVYSHAELSAHSPGAVFTSEMLVSFILRPTYILREFGIHVVVVDSKKLSCDENYYRRHFS